MITAALNVNAMTWRTSPAATELETLVLDWLRQWLGLPDEFAGVVYDTASVSTMHALAVAREEASTSVRTLGLSGRSELPIFRIYTSDQAHSSVEKAAIALGLGEHNVRRIASDPEFRMDVAALREAVTADLRHGFKPLAVVATVGTTSTASVDPVREIAALCAEYQMWLHIDAAYGGGLALLPEHKWVTDGWEEADSLVLNPHKMLFVPFDFSALYVRDIERLRRLFTLSPEHLHLRDPAGVEINYMDYGVQLGRRFRALKAWVVWRAFGREGIAARIREHLRLAQLFAQWIEDDARFEIVSAGHDGRRLFSPQGSGRQSRGQKNSETVAKINASGKAYLTQTKLRGRVVMRLGLGKSAHDRRASSPRLGNHPRSGLALGRHCRAFQILKTAGHCLKAVRSGLPYLGSPNLNPMETTIAAPKPRSSAEADFLPLQGTDYVEFYVGNAKQAAHFYKTAFGFQSLAYAGPETGTKEPSQLCHSPEQTDICSHHAAQAGQPDRRPHLQTRRRGEGDRA